MTPAGLLSSLRARGVSASVTKDWRVRVVPRSALTADEAEFLRDHRREVAAAIVLDEAWAAHERELDREAQAEHNRLRAAARERHREHNRDVMAEWSPAKVRALVAAGKLSPEDVAAWREARLEVHDSLHTLKD